MLKLGDIVETEQVFNKVLETNLPIQLSFRLSRNVAFIEKELKRYHEAKEKLIKQYGEPDENNPSMFKFSAENSKLINEQLRNLHNEEVDIQLNPIKYSELVNVNNLELQPRDIYLLTLLGIFIDDEATMKPAAE